MSFTKDREPPPALVELAKEAWSAVGDEQYETGEEAIAAALDRSPLMRELRECQQDMVYLVEELLSLFDKDDLPEGDHVRLDKARALLAKLGGDRC